MSIRRLARRLLGLPPLSRRSLRFTHCEKCSKKFVLRSKTTFQARTISRRLTNRRTNSTRETPHRVVCFDPGVLFSRKTMFCVYRHLMITFSYNHEVRVESE